MQRHHRQQQTQQLAAEIASVLISQQERVLALESTLITLLAWVVGCESTPSAVATLADDAVDFFLGKRAVHFRANSQVVAARYLAASFCAANLPEAVRAKLLEIHWLFVANYSRKTRVYFDNFCPCCEGEKWSDDAEILYQETAFPFSPDED